ncbi:MAG: sulfatase-like hydrolase/transferase, partial [Alteraurantiacibacter sp.]|nr:sulfatase-like hydrolase/transferase [Alteraurantiacibacter sp.]
MEAYAASLAFADHQIGRVIDHLKRTGAWENTLVVYIQGDNGASAEGSFDGKFYEQSALAGVVEDRAWAQARIDQIGGPFAYNLLPGGWGWAMNAPFPWAKRYGSHLGGTRNSMVVAWPGRIARPGALCSQFLHVSDVMPTVLDVAGISAPAELDGVKQQPITGISFAASFRSPDAPSRRTRQVFAMAENLAIYDQGWLAATTPKVTPWDRSPVAPVALVDRHWELYNLDQDFSQSTDFAAREPERLHALVAEFWREAQAGKILPIHASEGQQTNRPDPARERRHFVFHGPVTQLAEGVAPQIVGRSFRISAEISVSQAASGVMVAHGGRFGGYALFLDDGRPVFTFVLTPAHVTRLTASEALPPGDHVVTLDFRMDREVPGSSGKVTLLANGRVLAEGRVAQTFARIVSHSEGFDVGQDLVTPVDSAYASAASRFSGTLKRLDFELGRS